MALRDGQHGPRGEDGRRRRAAAGRGAAGGALDALTGLSVVAPAFNEADGIEPWVLDAERELVGRYGDVEAIVVDDRSTDGTGEILDRLAASRPWLRVVHAERNAGHGPSLLRGLELARGEWLFLTDTDGQFVLAEVARLWERRHDADLVLGVRVARRDPRHRIVLSRAVRAVVTLLAGRRLRDANVPFKLVRATAWATVRDGIGPSALAPSILLAVGASLHGLRIVEVPVTHLPRAGGVSTLRAGRLLRFSLRALGQLLAYAVRQRRARRR